MSASGRIPCLGFELPAGASAITAPMHYVGRDERCPAAKAVPDPSYRGESELRFSQNVVKKESNVRNGSRWRLRCARPLFRSFASGDEFEWRARSSELFRRGSFRLLLGEHALRSLQRPLRARVPACRIDEGMGVARFARPSSLARS